MSFGGEQAWTDTVELHHTNLHAHTHTRTHTNTHTHTKTSNLTKLYQFHNINFFEMGLLKGKYPKQKWLRVKQPAFSVNILSINVAIEIGCNHPKECNIKTLNPFPLLQRDNM